MIRLHIAWANALYRLRRRPIRVRFRRARYTLWSRTREDRPSRRLDAWHDHLHRMNQDESWAGLRFRAGQLRDARGRFVNPDNKEISA